jgi:DNA primase
LISKATIDQVFDTARVEEVIGDFVQLKKSGSNFKGLSPFSEERTPSFMVSPVKQIWKDFSTRL